MADKVNWQGWVDKASKMPGYVAVNATGVKCGGRYMINLSKLSEWGPMNESHLIGVSVGFINGTGFTIPFNDKERRDKFIDQLDEFLKIKLEAPASSDKSEDEACSSSSSSTLPPAPTGGPPAPSGRSTVKAPTKRLAAM